MLRLLLKQLRVHQWTKNLFVFAPVIFAKRANEPREVLLSLGAFAAICMAASATYIFNDLQDLEADRTHPRKRHRPLAAGELSVRVAQATAALLFVAAFALASALGVVSAVVLALYVGMTVAYSLGLKGIPILELFLVASGFVLRVLLGSAATWIRPSPWLLLTMLFLALLLAFGKRRAEIGRLGSDAASRRMVLSYYNARFLDRSITLLAGSTLLCYAIYCTAEVTVRKMGTEWLVATTPFVAFGILRYLYVLERGDHAADAPSDLLLTDRPIQLAILLWLSSAIAIVYTHTGAGDLARRFLAP